MLELTTKFRGVSSSPKARSNLSSGAAAAKGKAGLRYILRDEAAADVVWSGAPLTDAAKAASPDRAERRAAVRLAMNAAIDAKAKTGGEIGARLGEKIIVSVPNSWPARDQRDAAQRIAALLAPADSGAMAIGCRHTDKAQNAHLHFYVLDGLESREAAIARRPDALRVRQRNVLRLGDLGRPKELRREIAACINAIATERGLEGVEARSFAERGLTQAPSKHRGPIQTRAARLAAQERAQAATPAPALSPALATPATGAQEAAQPQRLPQPAKAAPAPSSEHTERLLAVQRAQAAKKAKAEATRLAIARKKRRQTGNDPR